MIYAQRSNCAMRILCLWALYLLATLTSHASGLWQPMHVDFSCWLRIERDWCGSRALPETYDKKSPWVYRLVQLIDSPQPELSCYLAESVVAATVAVLFCAALRPAFPRIAPLAPLLLILWSGTSETFYGAQTIEAFAMWCDVAAISLLALAVHRQLPAWAFAAGACAFLAASLRQPVTIHAVAWIPFFWLLFWRQPRAVAWNCSL